MTLEEGRVLLAGNHSSGAINRSYYAAFYAACALLDSVGLKARSHQAVITLLHREFVRSGRLDRDLMRDYSALLEDRMSGDYGPWIRHGHPLPRCREDTVVGVRGATG